VIRRSARLERKTPLRVDPLKIRAWQDRSRRPIPKVGAKTKRERPALDAARVVVKGRTWCQAHTLLDAHGVPICGTLCVHQGSDPHHMWPEDRDCGIHDPRRMLLLCRTSHDWADAHMTDAKTLGIIRPTIHDH
jgi:hypothetical protein